MKAPPQRTAPACRPSPGSQYRNRAALVQKMEIRDAVRADIPAITEIYNHAVTHTTAVWNDTPVDQANRMSWLHERQSAGYPVLVASCPDAGLLGYASFGDWRAWAGYRHTVEHSIHIRSDCQGRGLGRALMSQLIARARDCGKHVMIAGIEARNTGSIRLHEKLGFERSGQMSEVGTKFGEWLDLVFMQLRLDNRARPGPPPRR